MSFLHFMKWCTQTCRYVYVCMLQFSYICTLSCVGLYGIRVHCVAPKDSSLMIMVGIDLQREAPLIFLVWLYSNDKHGNAQAKQEAGRGKRIHHHIKASITSSLSRQTCKDSPLCKFKELNCDEKFQNSKGF